TAVTRAHPRAATADDIAPVGTLGVAVAVHRAPVPATVVARTAGPAAGGRFVPTAESLRADPTPTAAASTLGRRGHRGTPTTAHDTPAVRGSRRRHAPAESPTHGVGSPGRGHLGRGWRGRWTRHHRPQRRRRRRGRHHRGTAAARRG